MSGPWEDFQKAEQEGPWTDYQESKPWEDFQQPEPAMDAEVSPRAPLGGKELASFADATQVSGLNAAAGIVRGTGLAMGERQLPAPENLQRYQEILQLLEDDANKKFQARKPDSRRRFGRGPVGGAMRKYAEEADKVRPRLLAELDTIAPRILPQEAADAISTIKTVRDMNTEVYAPDRAFEQTFPGKLARGAGSVITPIAMSPVPGGSAVSIGGMMGEEGYEDAKRYGASEADAINSYLLNAGVGAVSEKLLGVGKMFAAAKAAAQAGIPPRQFIPWATKQFGKGFFREGVQESLETAAQNKIANEAVGYDPTRSTMQGVPEAFLLGGLIGGPLNLAMSGAAAVDQQSAEKKLEKLKARLEAENARVRRRQEARATMDAAPVQEVQEEEVGDDLQEPVIIPSQQPEAAPRKRANVITEDDIQMPDYAEGDAFADLPRAQEGARVPVQRSIPRPGDDINAPVETEGDAFAGLPTAREGVRVPVESQQTQQAPAKEPWQMTREEFQDAFERGDPSLPRVYSTTGQMVTPETNGWGWNVDARHAQLVRDAIASGKNVPESVIASQPDIAKKIKQDEVRLAQEKAMAEYLASTRGQGNPTAPVTEQSSVTQPAEKPWQVRLPDYAPVPPFADRSFVLTPEQQQAERAVNARYMDLTEEHYASVIDAIKRGENVPREVLEDYKKEPVVKAKMKAMGWLKDPWQQTKEEFVKTRRDDSGINGWDKKKRATASARHRVLVEAAIRDGKPVPSEVLAQYPDLKTQPTQPANVQAKTESLPTVPQAQGPVRLPAETVAPKQSEPYEKKLAARRDTYAKQAKAASTDQLTKKLKELGDPPTWPADGIKLTQKQVIESELASRKPAPQTQPAAPLGPVRLSDAVGIRVSSTPEELLDRAEKLGMKLVSETPIQLTSGVSVRNRTFDVETDEGVRRITFRDDGPRTKGDKKQTPWRFASVLQEPEQASGIISENESARLDALNESNSPRLEALSENQIAQLATELGVRPARASKERIFTNTHPDDLKKALDVVAKAPQAPTKGAKVIFTPKTGEQIKGTLVAESDAAFDIETKVRGKKSVVRVQKADGAMKADPRFDTKYLEQVKAAQMGAILDEEEGRRARYEKAAGKRLTPDQVFEAAVRMSKAGGRHIQDVLDFSQPDDIRNATADMQEASTEEIKQADIAATRMSERYIAEKYGGQTIRESRTEPYSPKNASTDRDRARLSVPPRIQPARRALGRAWDDAMERLSQNPNAGLDLVREINENPRPINDTEVALLAIVNLKAQQEFEAAMAGIERNPDSTDLFIAADGAYSRAEASFTALEVAGTETARGLNARKMILQDDFSLDTMKRQYRKKLKANKPLNAEEEKKVEEEFKKIDDARKLAEKAEDEVKLEEQLDLYDEIEADVLANKPLTEEDAAYEAEVAIEEQVEAAITAEEENPTATAEEETTEPEGPTLGVDEVQRHLQQKYGLRPDGKVRVVNNPGNGQNAFANFDTATKRWKGITINAAYMTSTADVDAALFHELAHVASEGGAMDKALANLTQAEKDAIIKTMTRLEYDFSNAENLKAEFDARGTDELVKAWQNRSWFQRVVGEIRRVAASFGIRLNRAGAEAVAARAVAMAMRQAGGSAEAQGDIIRLSKAGKKGKKAKAKKAGTDLDKRNVGRLVRKKIAEGVRGLGPVMVAVHAELAPHHPGLTIREVRDLFSDYGKVRYPNPKEEAKVARELRRLAQLQSALEDALKGIPPKRSGSKRDDPTPDVRDLARQVRNAQRALGIEVDRPNALRSVNQQRASALKNQIQDLDRELEEGVKPAEPNRAPVERTQEVEDLMMLRDAKKALLQSIEDELNPPETPEQRSERMREKALQSAIDKLDARIQGNAPAPNSQPKPTNPRIEALESELAAMRAFQKEQVAAARIRKTPEEIATARALKAAEASIKRLNDMLNTGNLNPGKPASKANLTPELQSLRKERDDLMETVKMLRAMQRPAKDPYERQRQQQLKAAEKSLEHYANLIGTMNFAPQPTGARQGPVTPDVAAMRAARDAARQMFNDLKKAQDTRTPEQKALDKSKKLVQARLKEIQDKTARRDFSKKPKKDKALDRDLLLMQYAYRQAKRDWNEGLFKEEMKQWGAWKKFWYNAANYYGGLRMILTAFDYSFLNRQGGFIGAGNPVRALKAAIPAFKILFGKDSAANAERIQMELETSPRWPVWQKAGLFLHKEGTDLNQSEENIRSRMMEKLPGVGPLIARSGRAFSTYLNLIRVASFDAMAGTLSKGAQPTEEELKAVAYYINVATGRGSLNTGDAGSALLFSPRLLSSRFELLLGIPIVNTSKGNTMRVRMLVAQEYFKAFLGTAVKYGLYYLLGQFLFDDDDSEETKITFDPASSRAGKIPFPGDNGTITYIDPLYGLSQVVRFIWQGVTGEKVKGDGERVALRHGNLPLNFFREQRGEELLRRKENDFNEPSWDEDVALPFAKSKRSPAAGAVWDFQQGKHYDGTKWTLGQELINQTAPLIARDTIKLWEAHGLPKMVLLQLINASGEGVQNLPTRAKMKEMRAKQRLEAEQAEEAWESLKSN